MTWHALLECEENKIQDLYKEWGRKSTAQWTELLTSMDQQKLQLIREEQGSKHKKERGTTERGDKWGGWLQELGDISPVQWMIIAAAKETGAQDWVTQAQKELTKSNMKILREYADMVGLYMGPDNGIRVVSVLKDTQNTKEAWDHLELTGRGKKWRTKSMLKSHK